MPDVTDTIDVAQVATHTIFDNLEVGSSSQSSNQSLSEFVGNTLTSSSELTFSFANTDLPVVSINDDGVDAGQFYIADSEEVTVENADSRTVLQVVSLIGTDQDLTFFTTYEQDGLGLEDRVVTIPSLATRWIGNFPAYIYNRGLTTLHFDQETPGTLKFRAFRLI